MVAFSLLTSLPELQHRGNVAVCVAGVRRAGQSDKDYDKNYKVIV